jgi:hypothetical protein
MKKLRFRGQFFFNSDSLIIFKHFNINHLQKPYWNSLSYLGLERLCFSYTQSGATSQVLLSCD